MNRVGVSWRLGRASWRVLRADPEMILLPVASQVVTSAAVAGVAAPFVFASPGAAGWAVCALLCLVVAAVVSSVFRAAVLIVASGRMRGTSEPLLAGLRDAAAQVGRLMRWAAASVLVGVVVRVVDLKEGESGLGRLAGGADKSTWRTVRYLGLPVLVIERLGVGQATTRARGLIRATWGENLAERIAYEALVLLTLVPPALALALMWPSISLLVTAMAVAWALSVVAVLSALNGIHRVALYHFATAEVVPPSDPETADAELSGAPAPGSSARS